MVLLLLSEDSFFILKKIKLLKRRLFHCQTGRIVPLSMDHEENETGHREKVAVAYMALKKDTRGCKTFYFIFYFLFFWLNRFCFCFYASPAIFLCLQLYTIFFFFSFLFGIIYILFEVAAQNSNSKQFTHSSLFLYLFLHYKIK